MGPLTLVADSLKPRLHFSDTVTAVTNSADTTLLDVTAAGRIHFIGVEFAASTGIAILIVDGTEVYRITVANLGGAGFICDGLEPIGSKNGNKKFVDIFDQGVDFSTSFQVKARTTAASSNVTARLVKYRVV
jgi:hypothetical protein